MLIDPWRDRAALPPPTPRRLTAQLLPTPGERILEIRPRTGRHARRIAEQLGPTGRLDLVDIPEHLLADAVHHLAAHTGEHTATVVSTVTDPRTLPFDDHSFDGAYVIGALPTLPDPGRVLDELHRVLHHAGRLVIADHWHRHWLPPDTARHLARRHGFRFGALEGNLRYLLRLHRMPARLAHRVLPDRASA